MYLDRNLGLRLLLSEITLLYDLSLYLDRTLAQRKAKSKVKVTHCLLLFLYSTILHHSKQKNFQQAFQQKQAPLSPTECAACIYSVLSSIKDASKIYNPILMTHVLKPSQRQSAWMSKITNDGLTQSGTGCFTAVPIWQQRSSNG